MNITVEKLPKSELKMTVELSEVTMKKYYDKALKKIAEQINIPGFRPGNAPLEMVESKVSRPAILAQALDIALPETYLEAIKKEKLEPIARPKVTVIQEEPIKYEAIIAIYPEVKVDGYQKFKVEMKEITVKPEDIEEVVNNFRKRHATHIEVDRASQMGDRVEVDFEGFDEGGAFLEGTKSKNHPLVLGEKTMIPGFEEELVGLNKDQEKSFKITFPKEYHHKPFQEKLVEFKVTLRKIEEVKLPDVNDEFVKMISGGQDKSVEDLKKDIADQLKISREEEEKNRIEGEILQKIADSTKVEIPETLIEQEVDYMVDDLHHSMEEKGLTMEKYLEATQKTIEEVRESYKKEAEQRITLRFGLQEIFKQEKIEVSEEEMKNQLAILMNSYPKDKPLKDDHNLMMRLENRIKMDKLFDRFTKK